MDKIPYLKCIIASLALIGLSFIYILLFKAINDNYIIGIMSSSAAILIAYILIHLLFERKGLSPLQIFEEKISENISSRISRTSRHGLQEVFLDRGQSFSSEFGNWDTYLNHSSISNSGIDAIGINLDGLFGLDKIPDTIKPEDIKFSDYSRILTLMKRIEAGSIVRIVIPQIDSPYLQLRAKTEDIDSPENRWKIRLALNKNIFRYIKEHWIGTDYKHNFIIKEYNNILNYFLLRSDDLMIVSPYLNYSKGGNSSALVLRDIKGNEDTIFNKYYIDFGKICDDSNDI